MGSGRLSICRRLGFRSRPRHVASAFVFGAASLLFSVVAVPPASGETAAQISTGGVHTCAVTAGGGAKCWGHNAQGQLGNGTTTPNSIPVNVFGLSPGAAAVVARGRPPGAGGRGGAPGGGFPPGPRPAGGGGRWGGNNPGGPGGSGAAPSRSTPVDVRGPPAGAAGLVPRHYHTCALTTGG